MAALRQTDNEVYINRVSPVSDRPNAADPQVHEPLKIWDLAVKSTPAFPLRRLNRDLFAKLK